MRIDIQKIDGLIAKLQELRRLASDPDLAPFVETEDAGHVLSTTSQPVSVASNGLTHCPQIVSSQAHPEGKRRGDLKRAVLAEVHRSEGPFSGYDITDRMVKSGFKFAAAKPAIAVNEVLRSLLDKEIRIARRGKGSQATLYEKVERFETARME